MPSSLALSRNEDIRQHKKSLLGMIHDSQNSSLMQNSSLCKTPRYAKLLAMQTSKQQLQCYATSNSSIPATILKNHNKQPDET
jgi:hypothetical protein